MNYTSVLEKGETLLLWVYRAIANKFTNVFNKLRNQFPIIDRSPLLKYSLIPALIGLFFLLRNIINLGINELASWSSNLLGEASGVNVPERTIVIAFAVLVITLRIGLKLRSEIKKRINKLEPTNERNN
ncbi:hypothetical protein [Mangrovibacterium sp.]|uniref:hypothetical protein n=1 Tax=Mangrovibacterium sp. TaxID=1961364 RepID=UPI003569A58B